MTGAAGFVGRRLMPALAECDDEVVGLSRTDVDLAETDSVRTAFGQMRPQTVVHLAACLDRSSRPEAVAQQWRDTFRAGRNVIEAAAERGVQRLLLAGSVEELADQEGTLGTDRPSRPANTYGLCKSLLREIAAFQARAGGPCVEWFRPFTVYGPGQTGGTLVPYAFRAAATREPAEFTDGMQRRDFLYVDDLVEWIVGALRAPALPRPEPFVIHHVGTGVPVRVLDVLSEIATHFPGARFTIGARSRRPGEPDLQVAPSSDQPFGWRPKTTLDVGIALTAKWWHQTTAGRE